MIKKLSVNLIGKRTVMAAAAKLIVSVLEAKGWIPEGIDSNAIQDSLTALIGWFLALKVMRVESNQDAFKKEMEERV